LSGEFLRSAISQRRPLANALLTFNFAAAADVHPERLPGGAAGAAVRRLLASRTGVRRLSLHLGWVLNGENPPFCFAEFEDHRLRAALMPRELLEKVVSHLGLALNHRRVARQIGRAQVQALRAALGAEGYEFALRRAPFLLGAEEWARLPVPPDSPPYQGGDTGGVPTAAEVRECGLRGLAACVLGAPPGLTARLLLKLPPGAEAFFPPGGAFEQARDAVWKLMRRVILQESANEWAAFLS